MCPVAPVNLNSFDVHAWNATVRWEWKYSYSTLALVCQVALTTQGYKTKVGVWNMSIMYIFTFKAVTGFTKKKFYVCVQRVFSGLGLQSVVLLDLQPDENYSVQVCCGSQKNFWKWGNWSNTLSFKTKTYGKLLVGFFLFCFFGTSVSN